MEFPLVAALLMYQYLYVTSPQFENGCLSQYDSGRHTVSTLRQIALGTIDYQGREAVTSIEVKSPPSGACFMLYQSGSVQIPLRCRLSTLDISSKRQPHNECLE